MKKLLFTLLLAAAGLQGWALDLYLIGPATLHQSYPYEGRDITYMVESSDAYTWIGKLTTGEFKIVKWQQTWDCFHPTGGNNLDITNANLGSDLGLEDDDSNDTKWNITEAGTYKLTINKDNGNPSTLKIEKFSQSLSQDEDDYYLLGTAAQLAEFAQLISHDVLPLNSNAKLTDDIDFTGVGYFVPIGNNNYKYQGEFDGQGHKISNLHISFNLSNIGVFGAIAEGATIKNFTLDNTCSLYGDSSIGIIGKSQLVGGSGSITLSGLGNEADVSGYGKNIAGILGVNVWTNGKGYTTLTMTNCYNSGSISGTGDNENGQLTGWGGDGARLTNCYAIGTVNNCYPFGRFGDNPNASNFINCYCGHDGVTIAPRIYDSDLTTGRLCYLLNNPASGEPQTVWHQTLSGTTDAHPVLFDSHETVKRFNVGTNEDPNYWYTNLDVSGSPLSTTISSINNLAEFSRIVNAGQTALNATLEADIIQGDAVYTPIGTTTNQYVGHFNGQGHSVTLSLDNGSYNYQGLFGVVTDGVFIENVIVKGFVTGYQYVGGIVGGTYGSNDGYKTNIWNCGNEADITGTVVGGIIGDNGGTEASIILLNCYNTGDITGTNDNTTAALCGSIGGGNSNVRNCYNTGVVKIGGTTSDKFCINDNAFFTNCYCKTTDKTDIVNSTNGTIAIVSDEAVTSGELCWKLGSDNFTQDLSGENYPTFGSKEVHAGKWFNDADWDTFYNEEGSSRTSYVLNLDETKTSFNLDPNFTLTAKNVSVTRNMTANQWIGLCLPFDYDIPSGWEVRELTSVVGSGESASMKFSAATSIEAGKPYIVKPTAAVTTIAAENKTIATAASTIANGGVNMIGNFAQTSIPVGSYYINTSSQLKKLTGSAVNMKGFRAYFTVGSYVKALNFDFDDDATGIGFTSALSEGEGAIYNVAGQRMNKMQKGINIINGKKILK